MIRKKLFFREDTKAQIKKKDYVEIAMLADILELGKDEFTIISPLVPRGFESTRKFMKHGQEVKPKRYYSLDQALNDGRVPVQLREEAFDMIQEHDFCGYSFLPLGRDRRKRKVSLVECLEGARIYAYSKQVRGTEIIVRPYDRSKRVRIDGAEIVCSVPSRTEKQGKTKFKLVSVPVVDSREKHAVSLDIGSDHSCPSKRFNIRYKYTDDKESSGIINVCCHEIAAYLGIIEHYWGKKNIVPLQMCQFAIPSQKIVDFYLRLGNNVLVKDLSLGSEDKLRKPDRGDKEIALWSQVESLGYDKTFYSKRSRDGDVADYIWSLE
ncbi:hypothetical protein A3K73_09045 [Candidatus Pacearchaeota archaeon RBG_13_36_9]|nr:MAG: hypothetical protein A3K73_09045 [Candidatus Pacearchaeota archaeon RBG_13_36_9]